MSQDLQWLLIRGGNSFMVKRVPEGPIFSKEPGNVLNIHSFKYSGLANSKTVDVSESSSGIKIVSHKPSSSAHTVRSSKHTTGIRSGSSARRAHGIAVSLTKQGYRPDLRKAVLARVSALHASKKEPKPVPEKKVRGKKAKSA